MGIREVAKLASVSTATVSRVITGITKVTPETRKRVLLAIKALDFRPDESARSLAIQKKIKRSETGWRPGQKRLLESSPGVLLQGGAGPQVPPRK